MKASRIIGAVAVIAVSLASAVAGAQAYAVGADGKVLEEKQAPAIAPENQPGADQLMKLFAVMRIKQQLESMRQMVPAMVQQQIQSAVQETEEGLPSGTKLSPEQREQLQKVMNKYVAKSMDLYPSEEMLTDMAGIYQKHLSKDDVDGLITFYGSPAGQHLLDAQPVIAQEFMPVVTGKVSERSRTMTQEMMKEMAEIVPAAKTGATKPPAQ